MRLLGSYLWKEWRDHRAVLVGLVLAVPLLLVVMGLSLPRKALESLGDQAPHGSIGFAAFAALACLALFVVSLATDLVPGEARRGHRWFLERLPGGLGAAFRGKIMLFTVGAALFAAYGYLGGATTCRLIVGEWPPAPSPGATTWIIAIVALWTFAVSCALPRGALSLPAVAALALLLALPAILLWMLYPSQEPIAWWRWESGTLWTVGAIVAAWAAFRRRGFLRAGRACLVVGALCAMPYWADATYDAWDWHRHSAVEIEQVFLGEGGSYAFVNRNRAGADWSKSPAAPVIVDLRSGGEREVGSKLCRFTVGWTVPYGLPHRFVYLWHLASNDAVEFDTRTAERALPTDEERLAACRERPVWRFADGRVAWFREFRLVIGGESGGVEEPLMKGGCSPCGLGLECWAPRGYYDFGRERFFLARDLKLRGEQVWVRPGAWLTGKKQEYKLFDPNANVFTPALGFAARDEVCAILDDGQVVIYRRGEGTLRIAPESGAVTRIPMPAGFESGGIVEPYRAPMRTPGGKRVFLLCKDRRLEDPPGSYWSALLRQDADGFAATAPLECCATFLGCPTDDDVIVHDDRAIYRLHFGSDTREEIWRVR